MEGRSVSPDQKLLNARHMVNQLREELDALVARVRDIQDVLNPAGPEAELVVMDGVPHRFYPGTGWVPAR